MKKPAICLYVVITVGLMVWGYYQAIFVAPNDAMQGEIFRILYYHVPSWAVTFAFFALSFVGSLGFLAARHKHPDRAQIFDALAVAGAEIGVVFCTVGLTTGPIWGRRAWGIWWTWDARLTTSLVLWLIYVSYLMVRRFAAGPQMQSLAAVLGIFGALDIPIVYMSNRLWRTQHPAPVFGGATGSGMASPMVRVLLWNMLAWFAWGVMVLILRYLVERQRQQIAAREANRALHGSVLPDGEFIPREEIPMMRLVIPLAVVLAAALFGGAYFWAAYPPFYATSLEQVIDHHFVVAAYTVTGTIQLSYLTWLGLEWSRQKCFAERLERTTRRAATSLSSL